MNNLDLIVQHYTFTVPRFNYGRIRQLGWFREEVINTDSINIEFRNESLILVPTQVSGAPGVDWLKCVPLVSLCSQKKLSFAGDKGYNAISEGIYGLNTNTSYMNEWNIIYPLRFKESSV